MRQLTGMDASWLYAETPNAPMHVGMALVYDQSTAPGGRVTFKGILANIERRLHLSRAFRQKLVRVPFDLDHPYWVEDPDFDLEFHVRHIALPKPGDWRQFCIQAARLLSRPLDPDRPLWECTVIEGLDDVERVPRGGFAMVWKYHHAAVDGMSGMEMITALHDPTPEAEPPWADTSWKPDREPSPWELVARGWVNILTRPTRLPQLVLRSMGGVTRAQAMLLRRELRLPRNGRVPRTRFNGAVSPHRVVDMRRFDLAESRRIKYAVEGATVNGVVIAVVGGALRAYLSSKGELPAEPLNTVVPISVRTEEERGTGGNRVSGMVVSLCTDIADPLERLVPVHASSSQSKALVNAVRARTLSEYSQFVPGALVGQAARMAARFELANRATPMVNTAVSNVPGPQEPLYCCGARLVTMFGLGFLSDGMGLLHAIGSYCGDLIVAFTADREMLPDPESYAECLEGSFADLSRATS